MISCDVKKMLEDPWSRNFVENNVPDDSGRLNKNIKKLNCWKIVNDELQKVNDNTIRILFDAETYLFECTFNFLGDNEIAEETMLYYWKGSNASKGFCPLPSEIKDSNAYVIRLTQWSEEPSFLHMFPKHLVILSGKQTDFDPNIKRLLAVRGELPSEIHLNEIPCSKENLRSRGVFLLIEPSVSTIFCWYGSAVPTEYQQLIQKELKLNDFEKGWKCFSIVEVKEGLESNNFLEAIDARNGNYFTLKNVVDFTPRLFYLNSITGDFLATEVEYPLRSHKCTAPFPFLQSHLYTANQPALFLLDNNSEIWLWEGWKTPEGDNINLLETELDLAIKTAINYSKEKGKTTNTIIPVKHVLAGLEPIEFTNIFPYWIKQNDITDKQLQTGHTGTNVKIINI